MAKRQNFVVGSINPNTNTWTSSELNNGWDKYQVLYSGDLDGVFNAVSDYSNDSSQEIANAIQALTGAQPTGASQNELAGALQQMHEDIETSSLTFKGYVATSAPSSSTYGLVEGNMWINANAMPTTFPVAASSIRVWNGTSWDTTTETYTAKDFDFFRNINDNEGYYWFGGQWTVMSTDMSTTYFTLNQTSGKWEIKSSVNLPGAPTATTAATTDNSTKIATTAFVNNVLAGYVPTGGAANTSLSNLVDAGKNISNWSSNVSNCITEIPQNINLTLSNGTLTLKSGSVLYKGDGSFTKVTLANDISISPTPSNRKRLVFTNGVAYLDTIDIDAWVSGSTEPTSGLLWFNTTDNKIYNGGPGNWAASSVCLPLGVVTVSGNQIVSIDQVFNGFGYMGSTVFALPNIKGLAPDGRNSDGSLKNNLVSLSTVKIYSFSSQTADVSLVMSTSPAIGSGAFSVQETIADSGRTYIPSQNRVYQANGIEQSCFLFADVSVSSGKITSLTPKTVFHAVDYNDFAKVADAVSINTNNISTNTSDIAAIIANTKSITAKDTLNSIVTTTGISKGQDGYVKLGNGIIIQWKKVRWTGNNMGAITLPTAFSSANSYQAVVCWGNYNGTFTESAYPVTVDSQTSSSITLQVYTGLGDGTRYINIIAIGY